MEKIQPFVNEVKKIVTNLVTQSLSKNDNNDKEELIKKDDLQKEQDLVTENMKNIKKEYDITDKPLRGGIPIEYTLY